MTAPDIAAPTVAFVIATRGHGRGGHFWSLRTTVDALSAEMDCFVVDLGVSRSPVVESASARSYHVRFTGWNIWSAFRGVSQIIKHERPDVIHLFDGRVDFLARLASIRHRIPLVRTKCGGPPPRRFFPHFGTVIVYSAEDRDWFSGSRNFARSTIKLIPNRLAPFDCDPELIADLRSRIDPGRPVILRIARFCGHYEESMRQGINLVRRLNEDGIGCQLVIVGVPHEPAVYQRTAERSGEHVYIFTEERFTRNAKRLIDIADLVIGTGRGFMEAASRGRVLLTPLAEGDLPLLVTEENFPSVFATNLSPRNRVEDYEPESNYDRIRRALVDEEYRRRLSEFACHLHKEHFDVYSALEKHCAVYRDLRYGTRISARDLARGLYGVLRWAWSKRAGPVRGRDEKPHDRERK